mmetsp:Transcript_42840/g.97234  ORF Transcript_42840/g.97234 Transcript_42840/m.97234 type:complete len:108 (+) Transcript_42840:374-697(+)
MDAPRDGLQPPTSHTPPVLLLQRAPFRKIDELPSSCKSLAASAEALLDSDPGCGGACSPKSTSSLTAAGVRTDARKAKASNHALIIIERGGLRERARRPGEQDLAEL